MTKMTVVKILFLYFRVILFRLSLFTTLVLLSFVHFLVTEIRIEISRSCDEFSIKMENIYNESWLY